MFNIGQRVMCVDDTWVCWDGKPTNEGFLPRKNSVYEIADVISEFVEAPYVRLCEASWDELYEAIAFRPIVEKKPDISIFRALLNPARRELVSSVIGEDINTL